VLRALISTDSSYGKPDAIADAGAYYDFADYLWLRIYATKLALLAGAQRPHDFQQPQGFSYDAERASAAAVHTTTYRCGGICRRPVQLGYY